MDGQLDKALALGQRQGIIGGDLDEHIRHAHLFASIIEGFAGPLPRIAVDLGSGGGLPALVLVARWPGVRWLLVEVREKRALFLQRAVRMLNAQDRVDVWTGDAQAASQAPEWHATADVVTARAFGLPSLTAECASPFLCDGGRLVVSEPPVSASAPDSIATRWPAEPLATLGLDPHLISLVDARFCVLEKGALDAPAQSRTRKSMEASPLF